VKSSGDIFAEPATGQKIEEHVVTYLDVRNHDNRPSLTSSAAAEERQEVSSKNTIDELSDAITGCTDIGLWSSNIPEKCGNIGWKTKLFLKHDVPQHRKDRSLSRKCTTKLIRRQNHNAEVVERSWLCFIFHKLVFIVSRVDWCARIRLNVPISLWEKESATGSTLRSHEQSMEYKDATITFSRRCN